ncbi:MAG: hypothetical protein KH703_01355 [Campylobacter gracilis]|uniref:hypothetical protein n=1 Tax=Campylobacter gracilis TaxID=824 RepID=UPI0026F2C79C|nr:hypothetical protein [Campylobacter gracilis]MBS6152060.1 hypothetical protein [Campylobacter gracilis]
MKKFYLKIWLLAFIAAFAAIPAAAAEGLDYLLKTKEEKDLAISCDSGNGKYSACTKLVEILSNKCDSGDYESCGSLGIALFDSNRYEDSASAYKKACEAGVVTYCYMLSATEIHYGGDVNLVIKYLGKTCEAANSLFKNEACKIKEELEKCLNDSECNPIKKARILLKSVR